MISIYRLDRKLADVDVINGKLHVVSYDGDWVNRLVENLRPHVLDDHLLTDQELYELFARATSGNDMGKFTSRRWVTISVQLIAQAPLSPTCPRDNPRDSKKWPQSNTRRSSRRHKSRKSVPKPAPYLADGFEGQHN